VNKLRLTAIAIAAMLLTTASVEAADSQSRR
jgi:hypothetical protein